MNRREFRAGLPSLGLALVLAPALAGIWLALPPGAHSAAPATPPSARKLRAGQVAPPVKIRRYSQRLIEKYDADGSGQLEPDEWQKMDGNPRLADLDRDGKITVDEFVQRVVRYGRLRKIRLMPSLSVVQSMLPPLLNPAPDSEGPEPAEAGAPGAKARPTPPKSASAAAPSAKVAGRRNLKFFVPGDRLPKGLSPAFLSRDADGDAQLTVAEFAVSGTRSEYDQFARYDANGDGVITPQEWMRGPARTGAEVEKQAGEETGDLAEEETGEQAGEAAGDDSAEGGSGEAAEPTTAANSPQSTQSKALLKKSSNSGAGKSGRSRRRAGARPPKS